MNCKQSFKQCLIIQKTNADHLCTPVRACTFGTCLVGLVVEGLNTPSLCTTMIALLHLLGSKFFVDFKAVVFLLQKQQEQQTQSRRSNYSPVGPHRACKKKKRKSRGALSVELARWDTMSSRLSTKGLLEDYTVLVTPMYK